MLILGRREGDSILIEGGIRIVIVSCDRGGVRIGIDAPPEVKILRGEIAEKVALENQRATTGTASSPWLASLVAAPAGTAAPEAPMADSPTVDPAVTNDARPASPDAGA
jgi:carbon storage regulator